MRSLLAALVLGGCAAAVPLRLAGPTAARPTALASGAPTELPPADAARAGVSAVGLATLDADAERMHSDALVLLKDGHVLLDRSYTPEASAPIELMSITKSIAALGVAMLLEDGALSALDVPLTRYFPEWKQGQKQKITLAHLLTHTSGLQDEDDPSEIWQSPDFVQLALAAELTTAPGTTFRYSNKAANLVGEVVLRASGERLDQLLARRLFAPLGIERYEWLRDPAGHALVQSGLKLRAMDLARIGELLRLRGGGLVAAHWLDQLTRPSTKLNGQHGLYFWIPDSGHGFAGRGYLGQCLLVLPDRGVVAVRLRHWSPTAKSGPDDFADFERRVDALFPAR